MSTYYYSGWWYNEEAGPCEIEIDDTSVFEIVGIEMHSKARKQQQRDEFGNLWWVDRQRLERRGVLHNAYPPHPVSQTTSARSKVRLTHDRAPVVWNEGWERRRCGGLPTAAQTNVVRPSRILGEAAPGVVHNAHLPIVGSRQLQHGRR